MGGAFLAGIAKLLELDFALDRFSILGRIIVDVFALSTCKFDQMIL
jgi:hypothetical protein